MSVLCFFFLQAEDGIRDTSVTGVQTCALPISIDSHKRLVFALAAVVDFSRDQLFAGARLTRNEHRSLRWRDQVNLLDDLAQGGALADELAEGLGLHHFLLQIGVMHFELRFEPLDFLEGTCVGNGGTYVVTEALTPGTSWLADFSAQ